MGQALNSSAQSETIRVGDDVLHLFSIRTGNAPTEGVVPVFYVGGSGCTSLSVYLALYFSGANTGLEVFGLDKMGVEKGDLGLSCSPAFWETYNHDELVRRNLVALNIVRQRYPGDPILLVGASEGGPIALEMARLVPDIAKVAVLGAGGMTQRKELELLFERRGASSDFQNISARIDANPDSVEAFELGYPNAYWSAVLDRDPLAHRQDLTMPILFIIGANDDNVPVASARLASSTLSNSQLIEWPNADHVFQTPAGNQRTEVLRRVSEFLLE